MTIGDLRCDVCGKTLAGPDAGVRVLIHPGDARLKDDSTLMCRGCWTGVVEWLGAAERIDVCARCERGVASNDSLHVTLMVGGPGAWPTWQLCRTHAVEHLNRLRTTEPKLTVATLALRSDFGRGAGPVP